MATKFFDSPGIYEDTTLIREFTEEDFYDYNRFNDLLKINKIASKNLTVIVPKNSLEDNDENTSYFDNCDSLKIIHMEHNDLIFDCYMCHNLERAYLPDNSKNFSSTNEFMHCSKLSMVCIDPENEYYTSVNGVLYNKDKTKLIYYPKKNTQELEPSLTSIVPYALFDCDKEILKLPYGVTKLGESSLIFDSARKGIKVFLPDTIKHVDDMFTDDSIDMIIYCSKGLKEKIDKEVKSMKHIVVKEVTLDNLLDEDLELSMVEINDYLKSFENEER